MNHKKTIVANSIRVTPI